MVFKRDKYKEAVNWRKGERDIVTLGYRICWTWHHWNTTTVLRRVILVEAINALLTELGYEKSFTINDSADQNLVEEIDQLANHPGSVEQGLLAEALANAMNLLWSWNLAELEDGHEVVRHDAGMRVYYPLIMLEGIYRANRVIALKPRKGLDLTTLHAYRVKFMASNEGKEYGWKAAAAREFNITPRHVSRLLSRKE